MSRRRAAVLPAAMATALAAAYADGPPLAHTGGFGEPTCARCHAGAAPDTPRGRLVLDGWPERFEPGRRYLLTVALGRAGLRRGGVQLSVRHTGHPHAGRQAGTLESLDTRTRVESTPDGIQYLSHSQRGSLAVTFDTLAWSLAWTAPSDVSGATVVLHAAGNASNDDASEFGDRVYTLEVRSRAQ